LRYLILNSGILNPALLALALEGIPRSTTVLEFQTCCGLTSRITTWSLLQFLHQKGIGNLNGTRLRFSQADRLKVLLAALELGCSLDLLSSKLNWRDFELFACALLERYDYSSTTNVRFTNPRTQIDVVAVSGITALIIDCKHWKKMGTNKMIQCANAQYLRAKTYVVKMHNFINAFPLVVTLHELQYKIIENVPFVPISKLHSFVTNFELHHNNIGSIS
jgi:hypothetical protein